MYESLHEASGRCAGVATARAEALLTSFDVVHRQVERSVDARATVQTHHVALARAVTSRVTADVR